MAAEPTGRMRLQAGGKIDRGQVRSAGEPFLDDGNVGGEHRWPTWHRFAPHVAAPMSNSLLTLFPTIAELAGKARQVSFAPARQPSLAFQSADHAYQLILSAPRLCQQCRRIGRAVNLPQPTFECLIERG